MKSYEERDYELDYAKDKFEGDDSLDLLLLLVVIVVIFVAYLLNK